MLAASFRCSVCALAVALLSSASPAQERSDADRPMLDAAALFLKLDKNGDGWLAIDEVPEDQQRLVRRLLRNADKDQDGKLSKDEFTVGLQERAQRGDNPDAGRNRGNDQDAAAVFQRLDANGDGKLKLDEVPEERRQRIARLFERGDTDKDGALTLDEFRAARRGQDGPPQRPEPSPGDRRDAPPAVDVLFRALDKDGDGTISKEELSKASESLAMLDKDGDGALSAGEVLRARPPADSPPPGNRPPQQFNPDNFVRRLMSGDRNGDGKLSQDELPERMRQNFAAIDANGDNYVDEAELRQGFERLRRAFGQRGDGPRGDRAPGADSAPPKADAPPAKPDEK